MFTKCKKAHIFTKKINQNQLRYSFTIENEVFIKPDAYTLDTLGRLYTNGDFFTHQLGNKFMHCIKFIKKFFLGCLTNYMKMILDYVLHIDFTCFYKACLCLCLRCLLVLIKHVYTAKNTEGQNRGTPSI